MSSDEIKREEIPHNALGSDEIKREEIPHNAMGRDEIKREATLHNARQSARVNLLRKALLVKIYSKLSPTGQRVFETKSKAQFECFTTYCRFGAEHVENLVISGEAGWRATHEDCLMLMAALRKMPRLKCLRLGAPGLHRPVVIATLYTHATLLEELQIKMDELDGPYYPMDLVIPENLTSSPGRLKTVHFLGSPLNERYQGEGKGEPYPQEYVDAVARLLSNSANTIQHLYIRSIHPTQIFADTRHPLQFPNLKILTTIGAFFDKSPCFMQVHHNVTLLELCLQDSDSGPGGFLFNIELMQQLGTYFPSLIALKLIAQSKDGPNKLGLDQLYEFFLRHLKDLERVILFLETFDDFLPPSEENLTVMEYHALVQWGMFSPALRCVEFIPRSPRGDVHSWIRADSYSMWNRRLVEHMSRI